MLPDDGPGARGWAREGAVIRNPLHRPPSLLTLSKVGNGSRLCKNSPHDMIVTRFSGGGRERLEREAGRNVEVMWLTGRLVPDHGQ